MDSNHLQVNLAEFMSAIMLLKKIKPSKAKALLAFDGRYLSVEVGSVSTAMVAHGEWHGRARFASNLVQAMMKFPPVTDPINITYQNNELLFAGVKIPCEWELVSKSYIDALENPTLLDLLSIERTVDRHEMGLNELWEKCNSALKEKERLISSAANQLAVLGITSDQIAELVDKSINERIKRSNS
jgi:hypothetical protein